MKMLRWIAALLVGLAITVPALTDDRKPEAASDDGFVPMFDGKTLGGWVNVNCAPSTFYVKDHEIITTGKPTGYLRTEKQYENFIAEFDWMHVPPAPGAVGNSGFFVWADPIPAVGTGYTRGIEVQVLVNLTYKNKKGEITATSQGDLFSIWGATCVPDRPHPDGWARCLPSENHCKGANEWNHYRVEANDGVLKLAVNGHVVSGLSKCKPRKGYLALESEGSECHFKNLKIKELPSTNPKPDEIADVAKGHKSLYTGLDLSGWKVDEMARKQWHAQDTVLHFDGKGGAMNHALRTEKEYADTEFIVDFRFPVRKDRDAEFRSCEFLMRDGIQGSMAITILADGRINATGILSTDMGRDERGVGTYTALKPAGQWNRLQVVLRQETLKVTVNGTAVKELNQSLPVPPKGRIALRPALAHGGETDFANLFVREVK
jgi:hypothetical protein